MVSTRISESGQVFSLCVLDLKNPLVATTILLVLSFPGSSLDKQALSLPGFYNPMQGKVSGSREIIFYHLYEFYSLLID